jgi:NAD-dependent dihydropyrimidine dehydrogenase PreA subunit
MRSLYISAGETLKLDSVLCTGCRMCTEVCPHGIFQINQKKAEIVHAERCIECGACKINCPVGAIDVRVGVGCAAAVINGILKGGDPTCGCGSDGSTSCC